MLFVLQTPSLPWWWRPRLQEDLRRITRAEVKTDPGLKYFHFHFSIISQAGRLLREPEPPGEPEEVRGGDSDPAWGQPRPPLPVRVQQAAEGSAKVHGQPHVLKVAGIFPPTEDYNLSCTGIQRHPVDSQWTQPMMRVGGFTVNSLALRWASMKRIFTPGRSTTLNGSFRNHRALLAACVLRIATWYFFQYQGDGDNLVEQLLYTVWQVWPLLVQLASGLSPCCRHRHSCTRLDEVGLKTFLVHVFVL